MVTLGELAARKKLPPDVLLRFGVIQRENGLEFQYRDAEGQLARSRMRTALRGAGGSSWRPDDVRPVREYANALPLLAQSQEAWIVEGESDCWILYSHGLTGIGVPGADSVDCLDGTRLSGFGRLYLVVENADAAARVTFPEGSLDFVRHVARQLRETAYMGELLACSPPPGCQDLSDVHTLQDAAQFAWTLSEMKTHASSI